MVHATVDEYRHHLAAFPRVIGLVAAVTRLEVSRIELHSYPGLEDWQELCGPATTGHLVGREMELRVRRVRGGPPLGDPEPFETIE
jgi:methylglyoxal synthase